VPPGLLRADGRSVYQRHGGTRYSTHAQLAMEERMVAQASADGAPRLDRLQAAHAPEQMMDAAAAAYVALMADGTDVLLMAADHALRRELSRRIRDDLIQLGIVQNGPAVIIAHGGIFQPPKHEIQPSALVLERTADRDADREAAD
jgi:hypothetical protein